MTTLKKVQTLQLAIKCITNTKHNYFIHCAENDKGRIVYALAYKSENNGICIGSEFMEFKQMHSFLDGYFQGQHNSY